MKFEFKKVFSVTVVLLFFASLAGCGISAPNGSTSSSSGTSSSSSSVAIADDHESTNDYVWDSSSEVAITLSSSSASTAGSGVVVTGSEIRITNAGDYLICGNLSDGRIVVDTEDSGWVRLILSNAYITCSTNAPIDIENADKAMVVISGTSNALVDGSSYVLAEGEDEPNAALYSKADLTLYGDGGVLTVKGNYNDGICGKDGLVVREAHVIVNAADDGIRGKDYISVHSGTLVVTSAGDGLKSDNEDDASLGYISIESGSVTVTAGTGGDGDGLQAESQVQIADGTFVITTGGGSSVALSGDNSAKGIKGSAGVVINGGTYTLSCSDDGIHSDNAVIISNGTINMAVNTGAADGIHGDNTLEIAGGTITISQCYEGLEAQVVTIRDGDIHLTASDDGINAAGDIESSSSYIIYIYGGYTVVNAAGDGLDANGSIYMNGGTMIVNGPTASDNSPIDYDMVCGISGGTLIAAGSSGMAQAPSTSSSQYSVKINFGSSSGPGGGMPGQMSSGTTITAGTLFHIQNSAGSNLLTFAPSKAYQCVVFSSPSLTSGSTYSVYTGGSCTGTATDGWYSGGTYSGGTSRGSFTVNSIVTSVSVN